MVFIHGLFSSPRTWDPLVKLLSQDPDVSSAYDIFRFEYQSPHLNWRPTRRIPDFNTIADSLSTFIEVECASYERLVLISHSQGGLIIQRYLARMIAQSRGLELDKIRRIVLLACPNNGSELLLLARKASIFWRHPQERDLRPLSDSVMEAQRRVLSNVVYADKAAPDRCHVPFAVYAGESDNVVTPASANSVFPRVGALPGDHFSILQANSVEHRTFTTVKANLLLALSESFCVPRHVMPNEGRQQVRSTSPHREVQTPIMKVTTTTEEGGISRSQEIEIFDSEAADLWIHAHTSSSRTQPEQNDAD